MSKYPWMKFWFEDLDRDCGALSLAARGAWMWIIGDLHHTGGERTLTLEGWSRVVRANSAQTVAVLAEIINTGTCDSNMANVTRDALSKKSDDKSDAMITIRCRRIYRETLERRQHAARQSKYRNNRKASQKPETQTLHSSPSTGKRSDAESDGLVTPIEAEAEAKKHKRKAVGEPAADARFKPVLDYFCEEYRSARRHKFVPYAADLQGLKMLLKRTEDTPGYELDKLKKAIDKFLHSKEIFHRNQGKPLAYFCGNIYAFMQNGTADVGKASEGRIEETIRFLESEPKLSEEQKLMLEQLKKRTKTAR